MEKPKTLEQLRAEKKVPSRFGPVDKRKNSAGTHSGFSRTVNLGIAKDVRQICEEILICIFCSFYFYDMKLHEIKMSLISVKKLIKMRYVFTRINISVHIRLIFHWCLGILSHSCVPFSYLIMWLQYSRKIRLPFWHMGQRNSLLSDKNMLSFSCKTCYNIHSVYQGSGSQSCRRGSGAFHLNKDNSIMVYGWTIKRSGDGQDKES